MNALNEYDVLRLIEHNRICYVSSDNVKGYPLANWIRFHPYLPKKQLYQWIHDIIRQLIQIHKCRGNPSYRYVNPYSIIVSEDEKICFLDISADSNREHIRRMQRKKVQEYFMPGDNGHQDSSEEFELYGLGKTIQYLLTFTEIEPELSKREERKMKRLISKCMKQNNSMGEKKITDILKYLSEIG